MKNVIGGVRGGGGYLKRFNCRLCMYIFEALCSYLFPWIRTLTKQIRIFCRFGINYFFGIILWIFRGIKINLNILISIYVTISCNTYSLKPYMQLTPPPIDFNQSNLTSFGLNTAYMFNVLEQHLENTQFK